MKQKKYWLAGIAVLAIGIIAKNAPAALVITEAMSSSGTGGTGDWFELTNNGAAAVNITGYKVDDNSFLLANALALTGVTSIGPGCLATRICERVAKVRRSTTVTRPFEPPEVT